ncbi:TOM1-like protein 2 [Uloborus diversus]|uniref:TOM1-like protein 2 n=1 Tax=Uloborus diversus TaxID=327109 RepID=UPI002409CE7A|nr:TOM1-like protein 2 [Uloborus diversus]
MAGLLSQLGVGGNPFHTVVGQRIEQATDGSLASENWALNMEICDVINETDEGPKDAVRAIRKRLLQNAGKNYTVVMYTLTVLETCVKNCGKRFQLLVTQKDFVQDLVKLIGPKNDPPTAVQEKVLSLIQNWAEAFRSQPEMQGVTQIYTDLKQKGIEFPASDLEAMAPIHTPKRTVPYQPPVQPSFNEQILQQEPGTEVSIHPQQMEKLKKELEIVRGNMRVFGEMLTELTPGKEHQSDLELLQDLCKTCQSMQSRIVELLDKVGNEKITEDLLQVNDDLNNLFLRYERFEKKRVTVDKSSSLPQPAAESKPLIDLDESISAEQQLQGLNLNPTEDAFAKNNDFDSTIDEFDMLAQSRKTEQPPPMGGDGPTAEVLPTEQFHREQDIQEVARWLEEKPDDSVNASAQPKTEEFDRFLASRAAAAERLPTISLATPNDTEKDQNEGKPLSPLKS